MKTEHDIRMCFDEEYAKLYKEYCKERKYLFSLYINFLKLRYVISVYLLTLIFFYLAIKSPWAILLPVMSHTLAWAIVVIPEYVELRKRFVNSVLELND